MATQGKGRTVVQRQDVKGVVSVETLIPIHLSKDRQPHHRYKAHDEDKPLQSATSPYHEDRPLSRTTDVGFAESSTPTPPTSHPMITGNYSCRLITSANASMQYRVLAPTRRTVSPVGDVIVLPSRSIPHGSAKVDCLVKAVVVRTRATYAPRTRQIRSIDDKRAVILARDTQPQGTRCSVVARELRGKNFTKIVARPGVLKWPLPSRKSQRTALNSCCYRNATPAM